MHHHTIFDTPVINTLLRGLSIGILKLTGWKVEGQLPQHAAKSVLIAAPHTSNWDLPYTLMLAFVLRLRVYFVTVLPKTRSGKLLRRALQAVAERRDPGDLTTMEDPAALQQVKAMVEG